MWTDWGIKCLAKAKGYVILCSVGIFVGSSISPPTSLAIKPELTCLFVLANEWIPHDHVLTNKNIVAYLIFSDMKFFIYCLHLLAETLANDHYNLMNNNSTLKILLSYCHYLWSILGGYTCKHILVTFFSTTIHHSL